MRVCQRAMKRAMLQLSLKEKITNVKIRGRTRIVDVIEQIAKNKWRCVDHVARDNTKWTKTVKQ